MSEGQSARLVPFVLALCGLFASSAEADESVLSDGELSVYLDFGMGRHRGDLGVLRGAAYGLDVQMRLFRHVTLDVGCEQYRSVDGTSELQLRSWRTSCGVAAGGGYRGRTFFVGAAAGVDALLSTHTIAYGFDSSRTWTLRPVARLEATVLYVARRYRLGIRSRVRLASEYVDARFLLSIGYAFRQF